MRKDSHQSDSIEELCKNFETQGGTLFSFLETDYELEHSFGEYQYNKDKTSIIKISDYSQILPGYAVHRFDHPDFCLDIMYGDKEMVLEATILYKRIKKEFGPWLILMASGHHDPKISGSEWIRTKERMNEVLAEMSAAFRRNVQWIFNPTEEVIDRARILLGRRRVFDLQKQRSDDLSWAAWIASEKFRLRDYQKVVELLEPFVDLLSPAQAKMLQYSASQLNKTVRMKSD